MRYYSYEMSKRLQRTHIDDVLQKHFPDSKAWGCSVFFDEYKNVELIEICKLTCHDMRGDSVTWTFYAQLQKMDDGKWEVNELFKGEKEDEMWIYGYYTRFADAVRCVASGKFRKMKPIKKY